MAVTYRELDTVVLLRDLPEHGLRAGDVGAVVLLLPPDALEVEFVLASGQTRALVTLRETEVRPVGDADMPAVRSTEPPSRGAA